MRENLKIGGFLLLMALAALVVGLAFTTTASAQSEGRWIKGTNYMITEDDATTFLEDRFDYSYCRGIARYGRQGEFPDEEFVVFECTLELSDGSLCSGVRMKALKGSRRGYFTMRAMPMSVQSGHMSCS